MKNYSILIVDDEEIVLKTIGANLKDGGYNVTLAGSGEEAIQLISEKSEHYQFDLVITDLIMEGIDGIGVLKKAKRTNAETMVIILTGYGNLESAIDAVRLDADDYILKPCKPKDLLFKIKQCLEKLEVKRKIKLYEDILPVCCVCKKVRDDTGMEYGVGEWLDWQVYLSNRAKIGISHGYCPECSKKILKDDEVLQKLEKK